MATAQAVDFGVEAWRRAPADPSSEQTEQTKMTADVEGLVLEHLRAIRADIAELKRETVASRVQIAAIGQQLGALMTAVYGGQTEMDALKHRVERIEQRLERVDQGN
jgi:predicted aminopeptidase